MEHGGIVFLHSRDLKAVRSFYADRMGMEIWLEQADCLLLRRDNMILGFCLRGDADFGGLITFVYSSREEVDAACARLDDPAATEPVLNEKYDIYQFFASDPEGRKLEFQAFLHDTPPALSGDNLLIRRRSVRRFREEQVSEPVLQRLFQLCRWAPSSMCGESYYYVLVRDPEARLRLAEQRGPSSEPIARAPLAVAACSDPSLTGSPAQDGAIAAYHLMLAARTLELGTCWIGQMNTSRVRSILGVSEGHHVATVTPLGYPAPGFPQAAARRPAEELYTTV